jgi:amidohydrolase
MPDSRTPVLDGVLNRELLQDVLGLKRELHRHPELGWSEHGTQKLLADWLSERGLKPQRTAKTGLYVDVGEGEPSYVYRGDIDALPIPEEPPLGAEGGVSLTPGVSHACGHDLHASIAAGLALALSRSTEDWSGALRFVFQPAEEVFPSGAEAMIQEGLLEGVRGALALHCDPSRDVGTVGLRVGALTATSDGVCVEVLGQSGHAARPHLACDAIQASAEIVQAFNTLMARQKDPLEPGVLSICTIQGGKASNVIAERVEMRGTLRTFSAESRERLQGEIGRMAGLASALHRCTASVSFVRGAPTVTNDSALHKLMLQAARETVSSSRVDLVDRPSTGAEDFGYFSAEVPTYMMRLGVHTPGTEIHHLHTSQFHADEGAVEVALRVMSRALVYALETEGSSSQLRIR